MRRLRKNGNSPITVLIADNQAIIREGIRALLDQHGGFQVVDAAADGANAVHLTRELRPDVAILSIDMAGLNGIEAARQIRALSGATRILILTRHSAPDFICQAFEAGAHGYLLSLCCGEKEVVEALLQVSKGASYVCPKTSEVLVREMRELGEQLSARERDVLRLAVEGRSSAGAANALGMPVKTLHSYRSRIARKLEARGLPGGLMKGAHGASLARALCGCRS